MTLPSEWERKARDFHFVGETLVEEMSALLQCYETMTHAHPDDQVRVHTLHHFRSTIVRARTVLKGQ